jgi:anti-anti-sigma factor
MRVSSRPLRDYEEKSRVRLSKTRVRRMADNICEMRPKGRIDSATGPAFEKDVLQQIDQGQRRMLIDFAELIYISSAGLRVVLLAAKRMKSAGGKLALCSLNPQIAEVFEISGFSRILDIHPSRDAALSTLSA